MVCFIFKQIMLMLKWSLPQSVSAATGLSLKPNRVNAHIHAQETYRKYVEVQMTYLHGNISNIRILSSSYIKQFSSMAAAWVPTTFFVGFEIDWFYVVDRNYNSKSRLWSNLFLYVMIVSVGWSMSVAYCRQWTQVNRMIVAHFCH